LTIVTRYLFHILFWWHLREERGENGRGKNRGHWKEEKEKERERGEKERLRIPYQ
jgi:hypothetical protein